MPRFALFACAALLALSTSALAQPAAPTARAPALSGKTIEYGYDGRDVRRPALAWFARAYVPAEASPATGPVPLLIFLHGTNKKLIKYRWMGGGDEPDLRPVIDDLIARGVAPPMVVAAPSSVVKAMVLHSSWDYFDVGKFIDRTVQALKGTAEIDPSRIIVAGHSGAGCSTEGGIGTVALSKRKLLAVLSIDTCMRIWLAHRLSRANRHTHVIVSYQTKSWKERPFSDFRRAFLRDVAVRPAARGVLRALEELPRPEHPHQASVALTLQEWLPKLLGSTPPAAANRDQAASRPRASAY